MIGDGFEVFESAHPLVLNARSFFLFTLQLLEFALQPFEAGFAGERGDLFFDEVECGLQIPGGLKPASFDYCILNCLFTFLCRYAGM